MNNRSYKYRRIVALDGQRARQCAEHVPVEGIRHALASARNDIARRAVAARQRSANTDGDALMYIYQNYVMPCPEKRKIIIVFSDGEPVGTSNFWEDKRLRAVCKTLESTRCGLGWHGHDG